MSEHTPGPWTYSTFNKPDGSPITSVADVEETVAHSAHQGQRAELFGVSLDDKDEHGRSTIVCYTGNGPNSHNNARLIAAAPDLLAACKEARDMLATSMWRDLAAFTKAEKKEMIRLNPGIKLIDAAVAKAEGTANG